MPGPLDPRLLDLPDSAPAEAEQNLVHEVLPKFGAQPEPLETDPRSYLHEVDDQRGAQTIQLLRNLAYLPPPAAPDQEEVIPAAAIERAWEEWTADYRANVAKPAEAPDKVSIETESGDAAPETDRLRRALKACASLEGEVKLGEWPDDDDRLAVRIFSFRLKLFGLHPGDDGLVSPSESGLRAHLVRRAKWIFAREERSGDALAIINALGDAPRLGQAVIDRLDGWAVVLRTYTAEERNNSPLLPGRMESIASRFKPGKGPSPIVDPWSNRRIKILNLNDPIDDAWNELAVKVVQVRLWTLGYYPAAIDGSWGPLSDAALDRFIADDPDDNARPELRVTTPEGYVVLVVSPLLEAIAFHADAATEELDRAEIDASLRALRDGADRHEAMLAQSAPEVNRESPSAETEATAADAAAFEAWSSLTTFANGQVPLQLASDETLARAAPPPGTYDGDDYVQEAWGKREHREYQGWRGIFTAFGRLLRGIVKKAVDFLQDAVKRVGDFARRVIAAVKDGLGYVHQIVRYITDASRVAVRVAGLAAARVRAWMNGTPIVTRAAPALVCTCWQHDFDTILVVSNDCPPSLLARHDTVLDWMARSFAILVRIGFSLLKLVLATAINWLLFAWRALNLIREIVRASNDSLFRELFADAAVV